MSIEKRDFNPENVEQINWEEDVIDTKIGRLQFSDHFFNDPVRGVDETKESPELIQRRKEKAKEFFKNLLENMQASYLKGDPNYLYYFDLIESSKERIPVSIFEDIAALNIEDIKEEFEKADASQNYGDLQEKIIKRIEEKLGINVERSYRK